MSGKTSTQVPSKKELLQDLRVLAQKNKDVLITRNFYRANGKFKEAAWQKYYPSFTLFVSDAGVAPVLSDKNPSVKVPEKTLQETNEISGDQWTITLPKTRIQTLDELLAYCKVDLGIWQVDRFLVNKWEMGAKDDKGKIQVEPLFQVKATLIRRKQMVAIRAEIESLKDEAKKAAPKPTGIIRIPSVIGSGNLLELILPDLHAGKLCWSKETGYQDYDTSIAIITYRNALDHLLNLSGNFKFDKIVLGVGNDLLQSDNIQGTTYSGTKVDTDSRFHKTYKAVREMLTETIDRLRVLAPVEVKLVPGNHDTLSTFTLGDSLECRFHNYSDVTIDNSPAMHKTVEWGDTFLVLTHGHQGKQTDYAAWIASQYPKEFGRTKFREVHVGHKHKSSLDEKFGVRVRTLSSLTPPDAWHAQNNFVGNLRVAEALVFNKERGLVAHFYHTETD